MNNFLSLSSTQTIVKTGWFACNILDLRTFWVMQARVADTWTSADKGLLKKHKSNPAKSDSRSLARKYFRKISESFSCVLTGTGLGYTNLPTVWYPAMLSLGLLFQEHRVTGALGCATCFCCRVNTYSIHCFHTGLLQSHKAQKSACSCWCRQHGHFWTQHNELRLRVQSSALDLQPFWFLTPFDKKQPLGHSLCLTKPLETPKPLGNGEKMPPGVCLTDATAHYRTLAPSPSYRVP